MNPAPMISTMLALVFAMVMGTVRAGDNVDRVSAMKKITDPAEFRVAVTELDKQMQPGGRYQFVGPLERQRLDADLNRIQRLLEKRAAGSTLNEEEIGQQVKAQNDLRLQANAILHQRGGERLICKRVKPTGSNLMVTSCETYAEKERQRADSIEFLRTAQDHNPQIAH